MVNHIAGKEIFSGVTGPQGSALWEAVIVDIFGTTC
jgi:hypothetical protein